MKILKILIEFLLLLTLGSVSIFFSLGDFRKPWHSVYVSCEDERYRQPIIPVDEHLVPLEWLYIAVLVVLPILFFVIDMILSAGFPKAKKDRENGKVRKAFDQCCSALALYYSGIFLVMLLCKSSQVVVGIPAPYFLTLCSPGCSNTTASYLDPTTKRLYVTQETCPSGELRFDTLSSFPCTHSTISFYAATFFVAYYCNRGTTSYTRLLQPSVATLLIALASVTSLSRINEYSNHAVDVMGGIGLGSVLSLLQVSVIKPPIGAAEKQS